jgi:holo-[acyl-carrier protein] synthase
MHVIGVGTDIIECLRIRKMIEKHGELFLTRVFTEREISYCQSRKRATEHLAGRWAAKEAVLKCLGTGMHKGLCWTELEVHNDTAGCPHVMVRGATKDLAQRLNASEILISIAHCRSYATAYALALGRGPEDET